MKRVMAVILFCLGVKCNVSESIDEDTIIAGYGKLYEYDFEYPLPRWIIIKMFGTTSWDEYIIRKITPER